MVEKIKLGEETFIYKSRIEISDRLKLIKGIQFNRDFYSKTTSPTPMQPGVQSRIIISTPEIDDLKKRILDIVFDLFNVNRSAPHYTHQWSYISEKTNKYQGWHTHTDNEDTVLKNKWTFTYYVQMPDNLSGDDGKLAFKLNDGSVHMVLPEVGDLYIFPCTLLHTPISNTNSSLERIVFAGVWSDIDLDHSVKNKKTLL